MSPRELRFNRSLDAALARHHAPDTDQTPDGVLLATLASSVKQLQATVDRLNRRISALEGREVI